MKVTRRQLRKIIIESILKEESITANDGNYSYERKDDGLYITKAPSGKFTGKLDIFNNARHKKAYDAIVKKFPELEIDKSSVREKLAGTQGAELTKSASEKFKIPAVETKIKPHLMYAAQNYREILNLLNSVITLKTPLTNAAGGGGPEIESILSKDKAFKAGLSRKNKGIKTLSDHIDNITLGFQKVPGNKALDFLDIVSLSGDPKDHFANDRGRLIYQDESPSQRYARFEYEYFPGTGIINREIVNVYKALSDTFNNPGSVSADKFSKYFSNIVNNHLVNATRTLKSYKGLSKKEKQPLQEVIIGLNALRIFVEKASKELLQGLEYRVKEANKADSDISDKFFTRHGFNAEPKSA